MALISEDGRTTSFQALAAEADHSASSFPGAHWSSFLPTAAYPRSGLSGLPACTVSCSVAGAGHSSRPAQQPHRHLPAAFSLATARAGEPVRRRNGTLRRRFLCPVRSRREAARGLRRIGVTRDHLREHRQPQAGAAIRWQSGRERGCHRHLPGDRRRGSRHHDAAGELCLWIVGSQLPPPCRRQHCAVDGWPERSDSGSC